MGLRDYAELVIFILILLMLTKPLGLYMEMVFDGRPHPLTKVFGWFERFIYAVCGIDPGEGQKWTKYTRDVLIVSIVSFLFTYVILRIQNLLPLNPQKLGPLSPDLAFNTAMSFTTNTNWQSYGGETTMSYFSQMVALMMHNFFSAAVGISVAVSVIRGIAAKGNSVIGNFWADFVRCNLYILLPLSFVFAMFLVTQGVIQNFLPYVEATTLEGTRQTIAMGPAASQVAIKILGTNGGGFFNANAAHPFENPTALSNFVQMLAIFLIASALVFLLGRKVKNMKHAWSVWLTMAIIFVAGILVAANAEHYGNPLLTRAGCSSAINMEGKEVRFGIFDSALFATVTTDTSCGAVNSMHDSFTPLGGLVPLSNILLGEIVFGGVGSGLYTMIFFVILTIFISGLMVGRTPEYLGKKIEALEVKYSMFALIIAALSILEFTAWAALDPNGTASMNNAGPHGFSEVLYAFASATGNNGSAFAGLNTNTPFWNTTMGIAMMLGRFFMKIPILAIAGSLAGKNIHPESEGTFPAHGSLFIALLIGVIVIVVALTYFPALALGPIAEHFEMIGGKLF